MMIFYAMTLVCCQQVKIGPVDTTNGNVISNGKYNSKLPCFCVIVFDFSIILPTLAILLACFIERVSDSTVFERDN